jgi:acyl phosphate:glycerol-3-phosphate acyltransferase
VSPVLQGGLVLVVAFALGSIPTGLWVANARGVDLRQVGSGNLGATNVYRALGPRAGLSVLAIDMLKGALAVVIARRFAPGGLWPVGAAAAAVLGHVVSPLAGFRGGKGVATGGGAMLALAPAAGAIVLLVFALTLAATRIVSLGSILAAAALPVAVWFTARHLPGVLDVALVLSALVIFRHRANLSRLLRGTEPRFAPRGGAPGPGGRA